MRVWIFVTEVAIDNKLQCTCAQVIFMLQAISLSQ